MATWPELLRRQKPTIRIYEGMIAQDALNENDRVLVTVLAYDKELTWGPAPFMPRATAGGGVDLPQEGDPCVVVLAETDSPGEPSVWILGYTTND
jgi:hypothetical protein